MTSRIQKTWVIVGVIWTGVLCLHFWNVHLMDRIQAARERKELLKMDEQFLAAHQEEITKLLEERGSFYHDTEALSLGLLKVESELRGLANAHGFTEVEVKRQSGETVGGRIPILFSFRGSLKGLIECLEALRSDHAYLPVSRVNVEIGPSEKRARCQALLNYRYRIVAREENPT
jgi:hypothetical protein